MSITSGELLVAAAANERRREDDGAGHFTSTKLCIPQSACPARVKPWGVDVDASAGCLQQVARPH